MMLVSSFVFVISLYSVFYFFCHACRSIVRREFEKDYAGSVVCLNRLEFLGVRRALRQEPVDTSYKPMIEALDRDFETLTYLLRNAATLYVGRYSRQERMLIIDYHLLRFWLKLKRSFHAAHLRGTLSEMTDILNYFASVMGQRAVRFAARDLTH